MAGGASGSFYLDQVRLASPKLQPMLDDFEAGLSPEYVAWGDFEWNPNTSTALKLSLKPVRFNARPVLQARIAMPSFTAPLLPARLIMRHCLRRPATPRESTARGVLSYPFQRSNSASPGI